MKNRPKNYLPIKDVEIILSELKRGDVAKIRTTQKICDIVVVDIDWENRILYYENIRILFKFLKHKKFSVVFDRIAGINPLYFKTKTK